MHLTLQFAVFCAIATAAAPGVVEQLDIEPVWSGHPVRFCLYTAAPHQFALYYDANRQMTAAQRRLDDSEWTTVKLPTSVGWDSHNSVTMAVDADGYLHVSGNMHCAPLIYFRSAKPYDAASLEQVPAMVGNREDRCTYPRFLHDNEDRLVFAYRDGSSGNGEDLYNVYDPATKSWSRLFDEPLLSGEGECNAYSQGPVKGPDGYFHLMWVWRDTPDCETNHDLSYARSRDLVHWERSDGTALSLPITRSTGEVVDPVPPGGGIINSNQALGFDRQGRVVLTYHKHDASGNTQIYNARREEGGWVIYQASDFQDRWEFSGRGTIQGNMSVGAVTVKGGDLAQTFSHWKAGSGEWVLDEATLRPLETRRPTNPVPAELQKSETGFPGIGVRWAGDSGASPEGVEYRLRWETLGVNRDRPHEGELPPPSMLRLIALKK